MKIQPVQRNKISQIKKYIEMCIFNFFTKHEVKLRKKLGREERKTKRHLKKHTPKYLCIEPPLHKVRERYEKVVKHCNPEGILQ